MSKRRKGKRDEQGSVRRAAWRRLLQRWPLQTLSLLGIVVVLVGGGVAGAAWWSQRGSVQHGKTAAIVDQLSLTAPDPGFVTSTTKALEDAGYVVAYYPGEQVTVEFYRHLPERNYDLVLVRAHSGLTTITNADTGEVTHTKSVSLFSSQPFDATQYQPERNAGRLGRSRYLEDGQEVEGVFGIEPDFVRYSMSGRFHNTLVVLMGCNGLDAPTMANAFLSRGAREVVGWDNFVSSTFTDKVTSGFLDALLSQRLSVPDAVASTSTQFGRDPQYGGGLQLVTTGGGS